METAREVKEISVVVETDGETLAPPKGADVFHSIASQPGEGTYYVLQFCYNTIYNGPYNFLKERSLFTYFHMPW